MTAPLLLVAAALPCVYWTGGFESRSTLDAAGIRHLCAPPDTADGWRAAGFDVQTMTDAELAARAPLPAPGIAPRTGVASPTRSPWIVANGWRFLRDPGARFMFDGPAEKAAIVAAEAHAYDADVLIRMGEPSDGGSLASLGSMLTFLARVPDTELPAIADIGIVDDGSAVTGEVLNLLARRNLLFEVLRAPSTRYRVNVELGSAAYPAGEAADPNAFAQRIRRQITDEERSLRVYGSEVVVCRVVGDGRRLRVHLLNYGGREIEGLRLRVRGSFPEGEALAAGIGRLDLTDHVVADGFTEFSVPRIASYAIADLRAR
ncbi:MAG TPA: hypothetical protein VD833_02425 [Vicinamibacterales bacterium]|nr:hypothetical protein [Vicinamibacterales bacterium]